MEIKRGLRIPQLDVAEERQVMASFTRELFDLIGNHHATVDSLRDEFMDFRRNLQDYRSCIDQIIEIVSPGLGLTWRNFRWLNAKRIKVCVVCGSYYIDYSLRNQTDVCGLYRYQRFSLNSREYFGEITADGRPKSACWMIRKAWRERGGTGPIRYVKFVRGEF
jgi:hypothetical protein